MDFLNDLGNRISNVSQSAAKKTKEIAEITKLNAKIAEEERKQKDAFSEIGKLYVEMHKDAPEEAFVAFIEKAQECEDKMEDYRHQLLEIKGVLKCGVCGAEVVNGSSFCNICGSSLTVPDTTVENAE